MCSRIVRTLILSIVAFALGMAGCSQKHYDVVVYGGTAGGTVAAIAAAREGASVALLVPGKHIGGMVSGGLGHTDHGKQQLIGGMSREFFERVGRHYEEPITWYFEPHVAERVFDDWLDETGVRVYFRQYLAEVAVENTVIRSIKMWNGRRFEAATFIDATYEGDLMAHAGVSYTVGREGRGLYNESLAGRSEHSPYHQFPAPISAHDEDGKLLPLISPEDPGPVGSGDRKVQAYNYRLCLTDLPENQVPLPKPPGYDPGRYALLGRHLEQTPGLKLGQVISIRRLPNGKTDINNNGPISTDHIGENWAYPEAFYSYRDAICDDHKHYIQGLLYFLGHDPSVPEQLRREMNTWGLAADEFTDTDHWPHQLYVREARRMIGEFVMLQDDVYDDNKKPDSVGMGSYQADSHHVQRIDTPEGYAINEGDVQVAVRPYEIPYRVLTPKRDECRNLLVPVCVSASHIAYCTIRMEPVYMILGHASGVAAAWSARSKCDVQDISTEELATTLHRQGQILSTSDAKAPHINASSLSGIVVDGPDATMEGWTLSTSIGPFVGHDYAHTCLQIAHNASEPSPPPAAIFRTRLPDTGTYKVRIAYTPHPNRASNAQIEIETAEGGRRVELNQRDAPEDPPFQTLGRFRFSADRSAQVTILTTGADGCVIADAVQWLPVE